LIHRFARTLTSSVPYPATALAAGHTLKIGNAPLAPRIAHRQQHGRSSVARLVARDVACAVAQYTSPGCYCWAAGARPFSIPARAAALMLRKDASGLRALGLTPASLLRTAHISLPAPRSRRAPAGLGQRQRPRGAQDRPSKRCERSLRSGMCAPALPRPTRRLSFASLSQTSRRVGRASRSQKHHVSRAWERSFPCRSLGRAPASAVTGSVSAGALPSPFAAWGRRITPLRPLGACANFRSKMRKFLPALLRLLGQPTLQRHARGLRVLAQELACVVQSLDSSQFISALPRSQDSSNFTQRS
jgi:hypothetical protein